MEAIKIFSELDNADDLKVIARRTGVTMRSNDVLIQLRHCNT